MTLHPAPPYPTPPPPPDPVWPYKHAIHAIASGTTVDRTAVEYAADCAVNRTASPAPYADRKTTPPKQLTPRFLAERAPERTASPYEQPFGVHGGKDSRRSFGARVADRVADTKAASPYTERKKSESERTNSERKTSSAHNIFQLSSELLEWPSANVRAVEFDTVPY